MLDKIYLSLKTFDMDLTGILSVFFKRFAPFKELPFFASHFTDFTKVIIYSVFVLAPLLFLKLLFPYQRRFSYLIFLILGVIGASLTGIFFGFMQLLFS